MCEEINYEISIQYRKYLIYNRITAINKNGNQ